MTKVSIGHAAKKLGVARETLRRWEAAGEIAVDRTAGGRRRYDLETLKAIASRHTANARGITVAYARIDANQQECELSKQVNLLESFCSINDWKYQALRDKETGSNGDESAAHELIEMISSKRVTRLVFTHIDSIPNYPPGILSMCEKFEVEVVIINAHRKNQV